MFLQECLVEDHDPGSHLLGQSVPVWLACHREMQSCFPAAHGRTWLPLHQGDYMEEGEIRREAGQSEKEAVETSTARAVHVALCAQQCLFSAHNKT